MNGGSNMLYTDFTEKLLGLQDVIITNVEESKKEIIIYAELKRKKHNCICCGTEYFHDYTKSERDAVSYFVSDMWRTYSDISSVWLENAVQSVDKFHWIRQVTGLSKRLEKRNKRSSATI